MRYLIYLLLVGVAATGCHSSENQSEANKNKVESFAQRVVTDLKEGRISVLDKHFDKGAFVQRVVSDTYWDEQLAVLGNESYKADYQQRLMQEMSLARMFLAGVKQTHYFAYDNVKIYEIDSRWHAVFRMYANEAINYHDYLLRIDSNKVWIEDVYIMTVGKQLSEIMKEMYVSGIPSANGDARWQDHQLLAKTKFRMANQEYLEALLTLDSLSVDFKSQKSIQLFYLQILANVPNENYFRAIENYEKKYPNDAGTLLLQLDKNFMAGNYPDVIKGLDRLEAMYGNDAVVTYLRGNAYYGLGDCQKASEYFATASAQKSDWLAPWQNRLECWVRYDAYEQALPLLDTLAARFDYTPTYCKYVLSDYPNFLNSSAFRKWSAKVQPPES